MSNHVYLAFFQKEVGGGYSVTFPDVPGAISEGDDFSDALANAKEALEAFLDSLVADGERLPVSRSFDAVAAEARGAIVAAVEAETDSRTVRVNISLDERLLVQIDRAAEESGRTRSGFLARAAREWLNGRRRVSVGLKVVSQQSDAQAYYQRAQAVFEENAESVRTSLEAIDAYLQRVSDCSRLVHCALPPVAAHFGSGSAVFGPPVDSRSSVAGLGNYLMMRRYDEPETEDEEERPHRWAEISG